MQNVKNIPLDSIVEVVIYDQARMPILSHPFHLHGTNFHVLDIGSLPEQPALTMDDIEKVVSKHRERLINKSYDRPSAKDSVLVPQGGWVIFRFRADNPGYWAFHCHFELHSITGMQVVVHIGSESDLPPTPPGFPRCGSFKSDICPKQ
ncbi:GSCOCG00008290001-RA-CDS [Cotesia congregata]|nr:GSCOCG00008290001-RA-CDS [Cotesia congregata]